jgi:hypothetical protein
MYVNRNLLHKPLLFTATTIFLFFVNGCRKTDLSLPRKSDVSIEEQFFEKSAVSIPQVRRVAETFSQRNRETILIGPFLKKYGQPLWDKGFTVIQGLRKASRNTTEDTDTVVIIPVVQPNIAEVQTYIEAHLSDTVQLNIHTGSEYRNLRFSNADTPINKAEKLAIRFMLLNKDVFHHESFVIKDKRLFHNTNTYTDTAGIQRKVILNGTPHNARMVTLCVDIITTPSGNRTGTCNNCNIHIPTSPTTTTICQSWWEDDDEGVGVVPGDVGSGGGSGAGGGDTPCTGSGTLNRVLPCGNTGDDGWDPIPVGEGGTQDPCVIAKEAAKQMDSIFIKSKADSALATLPDLATAPIERGFPIIKRLRVNPYNVHDTSVLRYYSGSVHEGTDSSVNYTYYIGMLEHTAATLHTHPRSGYAAHSAKDIYKCLEERIGEEAHFGGTFVAAFNGDRYAITITNPAQAAAFLGTKNEYLQGTKWNEVSAIGKAFKLAQVYFENVYKDHPNKIHLAYEMAMAAVLNQFNSGITLNKQNAAGNFTPIIVKTTPDPRKPKKTIYTQECL